MKIIGIALGLLFLCVIAIGLIILIGLGVIVAMHQSIFKDPQGQEQQDLSVYSDEELIMMGHTNREQNGNSRT